MWNPSPLWKSLPTPDLTTDVKRAGDWLRKQRQACPIQNITGIYLGLDTLNMGGFGGFNLEIALTPQCDPSSNASAWIYDCPWRGTHHLIKGLRLLAREYSKPAFREAFSFADYALFLGYSGIVLAHALPALTEASPLLAAWGFHDGDMFLLARTNRAGVTRLANLGAPE